MVREFSDGLNKQMLTRRAFMGTAAAAMAIPNVMTGQDSNVRGNKGKFKMKYAATFGLFIDNAGKNPADLVRFIADQGFEALEFNWMGSQQVQVQNKMAGQMQRLGLTMGIFVAYADFKNKSFVLRDKSIRDMLIDKMKHAVEVAKRVNGKWVTVVPGPVDDKLDWGYQAANVVENLRYCADVCEKSGLIMVLEPLNKQNHPGLFLTKISQAYKICKEVSSPSCKILNDLYHQQITEGNLINNIDMAWDEIAYFQVADNPGRKEPGTGEINYKNIFRHLYNKGYKGLIGMEHGKSQPGPAGGLAVIEAYRKVDAF